RCEMKKEGNYANALYTIRYFQFEGEGTLKMDNGITFLPNDRYLLELTEQREPSSSLEWPSRDGRRRSQNEKFRLYYTSGCSEAQNFIVVVEDNFGNAYELEFDFNNQNVKDETLSVVPIGNFKPLS
ncbi:MAG: TraQ conjugal transfer family protein, partial [Prevotella sp.]